MESQIWVKTGWDLPFQAIAAPWMKGREVAAYLNSRHIPGLSFVGRRFTPDGGTYRNQELEAVEVLLLDRNAVQPVELGVEMVSALNKLYPGKFDIDRQIRLLGNEDTARRIRAGEDPREIAASWRAGEARFAQIRARYLIYK